MVVGEEVSLAANMTVFLYHKVQGEIQGDLRKGGLLGGMTMEVDGAAGVDGTVGTRVVSEFSPLGELQVTVSSLSVGKLWLTLTVRELLEKVATA